LLRFEQTFFPPNTQNLEIIKKHFNFIRKMSGRCELSEFQRGEIIGAWKMGHKVADIAKALDRRYTTVKDTIERYETRLTVTCTKRSGRPPKLDDRDIRHLVNDLKKDRAVAVDELTKEFNESLNISVSSKTVRRTLNSQGYYGRTAKKKPLVTEKNRKKRLAWCRMRKEWKGEWDRVIFSDESRFELFNNDSRKWVWRKSDEKYKKECLQPTVQKSVGIMVWGCFCRGRMGPLVLLEGKVTAAKYIEMLEQYLLPFMNAQTEYIFQDDNAPAHTARVTKAWKEDNLNETLPWPAQSPDLNPIENLWDELDRRVRAHKPKPKNTRELFAVMQEKWVGMELSKINNLIESMPRRVTAVIKNQGNPTKY
jgi:transposase